MEQMQEDIEKMKEILINKINCCNQYLASNLCDEETAYDALLTLADAITLINIYGDDIECLSQ